MKLGKASLWKSVPSRAVRCIKNARYGCSMSSNGKIKSLFGLSEPLTNPDDFVSLAKRAADRINAIRDYLKQNDLNLLCTSKLMLLDNISNELCSIMDAAELCRNVHMNTSFVSHAEAAFSELSNVIIDLNSDKQLYSILENILRDKQVAKGLTREEFYFANDLLHDFRMEGIHLENDNKIKLNNLQQAVVEAETIYNQNVVNGSEGQMKITLDDVDKERYIHLRRWLESAVEQPKLNNKPILYCSPDRRLLGPLMNSLSSSELRKSLWFETFVQPVSNFDSFANLVLRRHHLAQFLDYPNYLSKGISKNVANDPSMINDLLSSLSAATMEITKKELLELSRYKQTSQSAFPSNIISKFLNNNDNNSSNCIDPWDMGYLQSIFQHSQSRSITNKEEASHKVKSYLSVKCCLEGLQFVTRELFGLDMREERIGVEEIWVTNNEMMGVKKFSLYQDNKLLGTVYFDLFQRLNKFPGAAHFTVRCGCDKICWSDNKSPRQVFDAGILSQVYRQIPTVVLTFSFARPQGSNPQANNMFLSLKDLETLYHEWGHALHSIFSKTKFQHLSGTRGGADFVEIPSHLMEFFARDPSVIKKWARNAATGEPIPHNLLVSALDKKQGFLGIDLQQQILLSAADQFVFSGENIQDSKDSKSVVLRTFEGVAKLQANLTLLPLASTTKLSSNTQDFNTTGSFQIKQLLIDNLETLPTVNIFSHSHFINYGGSYYSYLLAKMYAAQIWCRMFENDPLNQDAGSIFRKEFLEYGCSKSPREVLSAVAGNSLDPQYFLKLLSC